MVAQPELSAAGIEVWRKRIRDTTLANYHLQMGLALQREGDPAAAVGAYTRALDIQPDLAEASFRLVRLLTDADRAKAAAVDQAARRFDPVYDGWVVAELTLEALDAGERDRAGQVLALAAGDLAQTPLVRLAAAAVAAHDGEEAAATTLDGVTAADLDRIDRLARLPLARLVRALVFAIAPRPAGALLDALGPLVDDEPMLIFGRALLARIRRDTLAADADLRKLGELGWSPLTVRLTHAGTLLAMGRYDDAERLVDEVLAAAPGQPSAVGLQALIRIGRGDIEGAESLLSDDYAITPATHVWPAIAAIVCLERQGRHAEAEALTRVSVAMLRNAGMDLAIAIFSLAGDGCNLARYAAAAGQKPDRPAGTS